MGEGVTEFSLGLACVPISRSGSRIWGNVWARREGVSQVTLAPWDVPAGRSVHRCRRRALSVPPGTCRISDHWVYLVRMTSQWTGRCSVVALLELRHVTAVRMDGIWVISKSIGQSLGWVS